jgi:hypothetical protein
VASQVDIRRKRVGVARLLRVVLWTLLGSSLAICAVMMFLENSLVYFPSVYPRGIWNQPALAFEDAWFDSADGVHLHGWYVPHPQPLAYVLFCHGNGGNITDRAQTVQLLRDLAQVSVLIFDYRGYGRSEGHPSEAGVSADARAARVWLAQRAKIDPQAIVLLGESLGGGVAVDLAAEDGARGLVLQSTFTSLPEVASVHFPWLPVRWLMRNRFDSLSKIGRYHGPLLQSHGDCDTIVPYSSGRRLFEAANPPKQFIAIPGADHNGPKPVSYYGELKKFLENLPALPGRP